MSDFLIRSYKVSDRPFLRNICCETADLGEPCETFFTDREVLSDAITRYYTDIDSSAVWVAEVEGKIAGYLMGCFDTSRYNLLSCFRILPLLLIKAIFRGVFLRLKTWRLFYNSFKSIALGGLKRNLSLEEYPAHLHIDILKEYRAHGLGRALMDKFLSAARKARIKGVHLSTREDNVSACVFFERLGFKVLGRYPMMMPRGRDFIKSKTVIYGLRLGD